MVLGMVGRIAAFHVCFCLAKKVRMGERIANDFCYPPPKISIEPPRLVRDCAKG